MKKEYINPELEVVDLKMNLALLAGSPLPKSGDTVDDESQILAPEFNLFEE